MGENQAGGPGRARAAFHFKADDGDDISGVSEEAALMSGAAQVV